MNELYLRKIENQIDEYAKKGKISGFNMEMLVNYIISKINSNSASEEITNALENILTKLLTSGFASLNVVKSYCYYLISTFNHEFSPSFFSSINSEIHADIVSFDKYDVNLNALRNYIALNDKEIVDNYNLIEQILKIPKYDINIVINAFYFSNFPITLLDVFDKLHLDDYRSHKEFLKKIFTELAKLIFGAKIEDGAFLNLIKILDKLISRFICFKNVSTKEKIINSIIVHVATHLMANLDEILDLFMSFDHKLLLEVTNFPINLFKIYNFYRDPNNPNKKYEQTFHRYVNFLFENLRSMVDSENFTVFNKAITEFKIIDNLYNSHTYSTEIIEVLSKFLELCDNFINSQEGGYLCNTTGSWFDINMKLMSKMVENIDYYEAVDLVLSMLPDTRYINNSSDRIYTLFNFFYRLILVNIDYANYFEKESLILCLFKQDWFVLLIKKESPEERESRFRHDLFICLIEALYYAKINILKNGHLKKIIDWIKICLDIIDVCFKIIEWADEGESYKMYFLVLEETCLFFDDVFFCFIYGQDNEFITMKSRLEQVVVEISKRFTNKVWQHLSFANENSKYRSLLLLSQFLNIDNTALITTLLEVIFLRMNEIPFDKKNEKFVEQILKSCLFLGIRVNLSTREKIIQNLADFVEKIKSKFDSDANIINNIRSFAESILNYLLDHKNDPQIILDSKIVDKLNSEFFLIIPKDVETNFMQKSYNYNNLYLINICENSTHVIDSYYQENSSVYLDYFKRLYYYPMLEFNNDYCHMAVDNEINFKFSEWKLITGISDPVHIYYMYKINIDTREVELFVKAFNSTSCVLNNVVIHIYLSKNLRWSTTGNYNYQNSSQYQATSKEFSHELISPFSISEFSMKFYSTVFEKNNISIDCSFDMYTDYSSMFTLTTESFYIPLTDFFIPDNFCLYETKKFDIFYQTLEYAFTTKCFAQCTPEELLKFIHQRFVMIEFKSKSHSIDQTKIIMDRLKETHYKDFFQGKSNELGSGDMFHQSQNYFEENQRYNFKIKLASFCIYNFWIYIVVLGDYNFQNNKSILNVEVKSNDLTALNIISREKHGFFNELLNKQVKFY